jgi:hypothetical protein
LNFSAYYKGKYLTPQVEEYFKIYRHYPDLVPIDKAYSTWENRNWLKEKKH